MSQDYASQPYENEPVATVIRSRIGPSLEALRTQHEGPAQPTSPVSGMIWFDTTTGLRKIRNQANDGWLLADQQTARVELGAMAAGDHFVLVVPELTAIAVQRIVLVSADDLIEIGPEDTWQIDLYDVTATRSLFSATQDVASMSQDTPEILTPDQFHDNLGSSTVLELRITQNGSPGALSRVTAFIEHATRFA